MRCILVVALLAACRSSDSRPPKPEPSTAAVPAAPVPVTASDAASAKKPPDEMDERMRHCPVALDGATSTVEDIAGGVRFVVKVPDNEVDEARRRAHHVVEFAAKRTRRGHGEFDGQGGGHMKNCPVVTDGVTITATDIAGGAQLDVVTDAAHLAQLRADTRARTSTFPFVGATIVVDDAPH